MTQSHQKSQQEAASTARPEERADEVSTALPAHFPRFSPHARFIAGIVLTTALAASPQPWRVTEPTTARRRSGGSDDEVVTAPEPVETALITEARELLESGAAEFFQDGVETDFARNLVRFLATNGRRGFQAIAECLYESLAPPDVVSEALRWLAGAGDASSYQQRWTILQTMLTHSSSRVRDGAILGFAALDDPRALPVLERARGNERIAELRRLIEQVIAQLHATADGTVTDQR